MWFFPVIAVLLGIAKLAGVASLTALSWWWIVLIFFGGLIAWGIIILFWGAISVVFMALGAILIGILEVVPLIWRKVRG